MSHSKLTPKETQVLQEALSSDYKTVDIRLREGEHQFILAKTIASFQLEPYFPNVKQIIKRAYGKEKAKSIQFRRKTQTILKKMEKNNVVRILPKKKPWELQKYAISSFKFQDTEKKRITLAKDQQIKQVQKLLISTLSPEKATAKLSNKKTKICLLVFTVAASYTTILWDLTESIIHPIISIPALSVAVVCSLMLGKTLS